MLKSQNKQAPTVLLLLECCCHCHGPVWSPADGRSHHGRAGQRFSSKIKVQIQDNSDNALCSLLPGQAHVRAIESWRHETPPPISHDTAFLIQLTAQLVALLAQGIMGVPIPTLM
jgi:hypothetical protein